MMREKKGGKRFQDSIVFCLNPECNPFPFLFRSYLPDITCFPGFDVGAGKQGEKSICLGEASP